MKRDNLSATLAPEQAAAVPAATPSDTEYMLTLTPQQKQCILAERAVALAQGKEKDAEQGATLRLVEFTLAQQRYAVETCYVREVQHVTSITPIPCTPVFVLGVIGVRGRILSVIDLLAFFDHPQARVSEGGTVIVFGTEELEVGVLVDGILGAHTVSLQDIRSAPAGLSSIRREYLRGVGKEQLLLLDIERLFSDERMLIGADETEI